MWLFLLACVTDPLTAAGNQYAQEMAPLFQANRALGEQYLQVASKVKKNEATPQEVATVSDSTAAAAATLATKATGVHPTEPQLALPHAELSAAWKHRAEAYAAVAAAWKAQDLVAFDKAVASADKAADEESIAADHLDNVLLPAGVRVDLYP